MRDQPEQLWRIRYKQPAIEMDQMAHNQLPAKLILFRPFLTPVAPYAVDFTYQTGTLPAFVDAGSLNEQGNAGHMS